MRPRGICCLRPIRIDADQSNPNAPGLLPAVQWHLEFPSYPDTGIEDTEFSDREVEWGVSADGGSRHFGWSY